MASGLGFSATSTRKSVCYQMTVPFLFHLEQLLSWLLEVVQRTVHYYHLGLVFPQPEIAPPLGLWLMVSSLTIPAIQTG